jgi:hypothetical protein
MLRQNRSDWNGSRFRRGDLHGFYESYFQRANHSSRPLAFWIRYTVFCPRNRPDEAGGEIWAIYFDGEKDCITAVKEAVSISECSLSPTQLEVRIGSATLTERGLEGRASSESHHFAWSLEYGGEDPPLLLLPESLYQRGFPKAKALVGTPNAMYNGTLIVDGSEVHIDDWRGSQNHNWGSRHTDRYAWGQVAGFDNAPDVFLECSTAQIKVGPLWSPRLTFAVLRDEGNDFALNGLLRAVRAFGRFEFFVWDIDTRNSQVHISGRIHAPASAFVALTYLNPPGGRKSCLNTKLASAEITVQRRGRPSRTLVTKHRAAFEILTDRDDHGVSDGCLKGRAHSALQPMQEPEEEIPTTIGE